MRNTERHILKAVATVLVAAVEAVAEGQPASSRRIVVSIPDRQLMLIEEGRVVRTYAVAVGAPGTPSPKGTFTVVSRVQNPAWYRPGKVVPPGASNPLGPRWIGLSEKGYGIHGTNRPRSIGKARSHGCIRMRNADVQELFEMVGFGDIVELRSEKTSELDVVLYSTTRLSTER
jgi:lipoprotein-anchoring transpeptidase ErfK/SrfK